MFGGPKDSMEKCQYDKSSGRDFKTEPHSIMMIEFVVGITLVFLLLSEFCKGKL